jgi:hypothetical protein
MPYRPEIQIGLSKWELFLAKLVLVIFGFGIIYATANWSNVPEVIQLHGNKGKEINKLFYLIAYIGQFLSFTGIGFYYIFFLGRNKYCGGRSVSSQLGKNILQYRIETSFLLCEFTLLRLILTLSFILEVERQIGNIYILDNLWYISLIPVLIVWLIHHILWSRLADK